jgi:glycosyltransferase involved in cell wall biosynthesis
VSIVTPTKDRLPLLREALDSVAAQTFPHWEHLVIDDGSDDGTSEEVRSRGAIDSRVRYLRREGEERGANVCRNIGVREARGEYVIFLDSDDLLEPHCLAGRVAFMTRNADLDFATFQTRLFVKTPGDLNRLYTDDEAGDHLLRFLLLELPWVITGPIWRKSSLQRIGLLDQALPSWQDVELHLRALTKGCHYLQVRVPDHHVRWAYDETRVSRQQRHPTHLIAAPSTIQKFERLVRDGPGMNWVRQRALCGLYFLVAALRVEVESLGPGLRTWRMVQEKRIAPPLLYFSGAALLLLAALRVPGAGRLTQKWKGWVRFRTNPDLLAT